jgi:DNA-binding transcriptional LysR family regulator
MREIERTTGLLAFVRAAEAGSFSAAARLAGTTPSAVSKNVERLEKRLGVRLFLRSTRSLALTVEGAAYYERVAPLLQALDDAGDALGDSGNPRGRLRVSLPGIIAPFLVDALMRDFAPRYPAIRLAIGVTDRHVDLVREGFDVALRIGPVGDSDWIVRALGHLDLILAAAPAHLARAGTPRSIEELGRAAHVRYLLGSQAYALHFADGTRLTPEGVLDSDSGQAMRIAALNGAGIVQLLRLALADDLASGALVEVLPDRPLAPVPVQALHAFGRIAPLRVRLFTDFVAAALAPHLSKR